MASNFNLPPGVTQNMIPGNRPEDLRRERLLEELSAIIPFGELTEERSDKLADYVEQAMENAYSNGVKEAKRDAPETLIHYKVPTSRMDTYVTWDGQMVDIAAPVNVEVEVRGDQKVLWVNVDGVARLRICRIQAELVVKCQSDGRTE
jgi:hypothetical protein